MAEAGPYGFLGTPESADNRHLSATGAAATVLPAMREAEKQFSLTRAASTAT